MKTSKIIYFWVKKNGNQRFFSWKNKSNLSNNFTWNMSDKKQVYECMWIDFKKGAVWFKILKFLGWAPLIKYTNTVLGVLTPKTSTLLQDFESDSFFFDKIRTKQFLQNQFQVKSEWLYTVWRLTRKLLSQCGKTRNLLIEKNISSNHLFSTFFSKNITLTEFLPKMCVSKFP